MNLLTNELFGGTPGPRRTAGGVELRAVFLDASFVGGFVDFGVLK